MKKLIRTHLWLLVILALALFVRVFRLEQAPLRLTHDEMSLGYNAYSLAKTGKDEWGRSWPLSFEAFGDHKLPGYIYVALPFVASLGLSTLALKMPSVLAGLAIIVFSYLITLKLTKKTSTSLVVATVLALNPWSIHLSRMAFESNLALAFFTGGLFFSLDFLTGKPKRWQLILIGLLFALSSYTYVAFRLTSLLTLIALSLLSFKNRPKLKNLSIIWLSFIILLLPLAPQLLGKSGSARFVQVSVFTDEGITAKVTEQRNFCFLQNPTVLPKVCKILFNRYGYLGEKIIGNYLNFILPSFLFIEGDRLEYLNDPDFGEFLLILLPFYLIGLFTLFKNKNDVSRFLLAVFFIAPIASALAGPPQIVRGSGLLPLISIMIGIGFFELINQFNPGKIKQLLTVVVCLIFAGSFVQYFISYQYIYSARQENYLYPLDQRTVTYINDNEKKYDSIYFSSHFPDAHILLAFYQKIDPVYYQQNIVRPNPDHFGFSHPSQLGKYEFGDLSWHDLLCRDQKPTLFVTFNDELPKTWLINDHLHLIKDFSGVHTQAQFIDLGLVRNYLSEQKLLESTCL